MFEKAPGNRKKESKKKKSLIHNSYDAIRKKADKFMLRHSAAISCDVLFIGKTEHHNNIVAPNSNSNLDSNPVKDSKSRNR